MESNQELSPIGRRLRVFAILSRVIEIKEECSWKDFLMNGKVHSVRIACNDKTIFKVQIDDKNFSFDEFCEPKDIEPRCGWVKMNKIGVPSSKINKAPLYNQRRNLYSTTLKR